MLLSALRCCVQQHASSVITYWVAFSGGLDSRVLLSLCQALQQELPMRVCAIHVNHQLHPQSDQWAASVRQICLDAMIPCIEKKVTVSVVAGESLEEKARQLRYAVFAELMQAGDVLLTAHQQDDQAETVLVQLCRGAGPKGLAAMPISQPFAKGSHWRPLLAFPRTMLEAYARDQQLSWIDDASNQNQAYTRNFFRHSVLPLLQTRWSTVSETIARSASHCAESQVLLEEYSLMLGKDAQGSHDHTLSVRRLLALTLPQRRLVLRSWIAEQGFLFPDTKKLAALCQDVLLAGMDRMPCVRWSGAEVRRYRDDLYLMLPLVATAPPSLNSYVWEISQPFLLPGFGELVAEPTQGLGFKSSFVSVTVRFRRGGEVIHLPGRGHHTLKNLFQSWGVPPWERARVPLLFDGDVCAGVVGYAVAAGYVAGPGESGWIASPRARRGVRNDE